MEGYRRLAFMLLDDDVAAASPASVYRVLKSADRLGRPSPSNERKGKGFHQPSRPHRHWHIDFSHLNICGMTHVTTSPYYPQSNGKKERWFGTLKRECIRPATPLSLEEARRLVARFVEHYNTVRLHSAIDYVTPADKLLGLEPVIYTERDRKLEEARQRRTQIRQAARGKLDPPRHAEPSANGTRGRQRPLDLAVLRRQVSIEQVLRRLGYLDPLRGCGPQRRGPCPLHDAPSDRHHSFSVHLGKGVFRCFHPECQAQGNTLDLWAAYHRLPIGQAAESLAKIFAPHLTSAEKSVTEKRNP